MSDQIFQDLLRAIDNVDIAPEDPRVFWLQRRIQEIVPGSSHCFSPRALRRKSMSGLDVHVQRSAEIFLDDCHAVEWNLVGPLLYSVELGRENGQGVIGGVADEESKIDEIVRVGELGQEIKILDQIGGSVSQRRQDKDSFSIADRSRRGDDGIEVDPLNGARVDFVRFMVIEQHWCLQVLIPRHHFVLGHLIRGL